MDLKYIPKVGSRKLVAGLDVEYRENNQGSPGFLLEKSSVLMAGPFIEMENVGGGGGTALGGYGIRNLVLGLSNLRFIFNI